MQIRIVVFEGADELDFVAPLEVLVRAARLAGSGDVRLVGVRGGPEFRAAHGLVVRVAETLVPPADVVIVPGGGWAAGSSSGIRAELADGTLPARLRQLHDHGAVLAAVCTGALALGAAGLLGGRPAATHTTARDELVRLGARPAGERVVDDGDLITAGGVTAGLDLALHLVERFWSAEIAGRVASAIEYPARGAGR